MKERNQILDYLKGLAILIVILGHALQGARHGATDVPLHQFILSFQMEFFFLLSGFSAAYSLDRPILEGVWRRLLRLGLPYLSWVAVFYLAETVLGIKEGSLSEALTAFLLSGFWFLRVLLLISLAFLPIRVSIARVPVGCLVTAAVLFGVSRIPGQELSLWYALFFALGLAANLFLCRGRLPILLPRPLLAFAAPLGWCGRHSLALYAIHWNIFFVFLSLQLVDFSHLVNRGSTAFPLLVAGLFSLYLLGSVLLTLFLRRVPLARLIFLGEE